MPKRLTEAQQAAYQRDGFVAPIDIFTTDEVAQIHAELDAAESSSGSGNQSHAPPMSDADSFLSEGEAEDADAHATFTVSLFFNAPSLR